MVLKYYNFDLVNSGSVFKPMQGLYESCLFAEMYSPFFFSLDNNLILIAGIEKDIDKKTDRKLSSSNIK